MAVHLITIYGACVMSIHQLMLENAFEAFSHHILIFGIAKHTHWYWILIMAGTWAQEKVKEKLAKSLHIVRLNLYKAFEYIYLSKNKSTSDWIVPAVSAAQSGSMFPLGTTLQPLNWTFYLSVLNSAPGHGHQPSTSPATQHELCPSYSLQVRRRHQIFTAVCSKWQ